MTHNCHCEPKPATKPAKADDRGPPPASVEPFRDEPAQGATPETDAAELPIRLMTTCNGHVEAEFARQLERERNALQKENAVGYAGEARAAKAEVERLRAELGNHTHVSCGNQMHRIRILAAVLGDEIHCPICQSTEIQRLKTEIETLKRDALASKPKGE